MKLYLPLAALLAVGACKTDNKSVRSQPPASEPTVVAPHMKQHFVRVVAVRDAVIRGDFAATREPSRQLVENVAPPGAPAAWTPMLDELQTSANGLDQAKKLDDVARALGPVLSSCGVCHQTLDATVPTPADLARPAPTGDGFEQRMERHVWALGQLWFGLIAPDATAWKRGAELVATDNLHPPKGPAMPTDAELLEGVADRLKALGHEAKTTNTISERSRVYGDMLSTCVHCHELSRPR